MMTPAKRVFFSGTRQITPLLDRLAPIAAAGFDAVSVWPGDLKGLGSDALAEKLAATGITVTDYECIGNWLPGHATGTGIFAELVRPSTPELSFRYALQVSAPTIAVVEIMEQPWAPDVMVPALRAICDRAADEGMRTSFEFVPFGAVPTLDRALELIDRTARDNLGLVVDAWHFFRGGSSLDQLARMNGNRIYSIQLNDAAALPEDNLGTGMMERLLPGEGDFDLKDFMQALAATGTTAPMGIEVFSSALDALDMETAARRCAESLDYCLSLAG